MHVARRVRSRGVRMDQARAAEGQAALRAPGPDVRTPRGTDIDPLASSSTSPRWRGSGTPGIAPRYPRLYAKYASELVRRYGPRGYFWRRNPSLPKRPIRTWQIWNEPHLQYQLLPHRGWLKRYGELLRVVPWRSAPRPEGEGRGSRRGNDAWKAGVAAPPQPGARLLRRRRAATCTRGTGRLSRDPAPLPSRAQRLRRAAQADLHHRDRGIRLARRVRRPHRRPLPGDRRGAARI